MQEITFPSLGITSLDIISLLTDWLGVVIPVIGVFLIIPPAFQGAGFAIRKINQALCLDERSAYEEGYKSGRVRYYNETGESDGYTDAVYDDMDLDMDHDYEFIPK
jgi:hypothetical protein